MKKILILVVTCIFIFGIGITYAQNVDLTPDGKIPGKPFEALQNQIDDLNARLNAMEVNGGIHVYDSGEPPQYLGIYAGRAPGAGLQSSSTFFNPTIKLFFIIDIRASSNFYGQVLREHYDIDSSGNIVLWQKDRLIHLCDNTYVTGIGVPSFVTISGTYDPECNFGTAPPNFEGWRYDYREIQLSEIPFSLPVSMPLKYDVVVPTP